MFQYGFFELIINDKMFIHIGELHIRGHIEDNCVFSNTGYFEFCASVLADYFLVYYFHDNILSYGNVVFFWF